MKPAPDLTQCHAFSQSYNGVGCSNLSGLQRKFVGLNHDSKVETLVATFSGV